MQFVKMHGAGNDYLYVNCFAQRVDDPVWLARKVSDRHFGIGADGLVLICPSETADARMDIYNADGSRAKMCGNAVRCVGKYAYERGLVSGASMTLETLSGIKHLDLYPENGRVSRVTVNMGRPELRGLMIPTALDGDIVERPVTVGCDEYAITCVSMGNPHCVLFVDDPATYPVEAIGPIFERDPIFPEGINTEFVSVAEDGRIVMRVWERGSGETLACGTGACAALVACARTGRTGREAEVVLPGGRLHIRWDAETGDVFMTGPAVELFSVEVDLERIAAW